MGILRRAVGSERKFGHGLGFKEFFMKSDPFVLGALFAFAKQLVYDVFEYLS